MKPHGRELQIDLFCGGGGAAMGIIAATGHKIDIAVNHDEEARRMYWMNTGTIPLGVDVWQVPPREVILGRPVGLLWASPDCTHHSNAKGGKPRENARRCLADVVIDWAEQGRPRVIMLENVPEFEKWGPLNAKGHPIKSRQGEDFKRWIKALRKLGYVVQWRHLTASDYGVPTSRTRLFLIARCDGEPIVWPKPTHGPGLIPYRTAAECIDWSLPCPSIFLTKDQAKKYNCRRPLAENTLKRIAKGLRKFVIETGDPFVIGIDHKSSQSAQWPISEPLRTVTLENRFALIAPCLTKYHGDRGTDSDGRGQQVTDPLLTQDTQNRFALVSAFLTKYYTGVTGSDVGGPLHTVTAIDHNALIATHLTKFYGTNVGSDLRDPLPTVTGGGQHLAEVRAFLIKYYGCGDGQSLHDPMHTVTSKDRMGLVTVAGQEYQIADIGLRMLTPKELAKAHDFPDDFVMVGTKTNQVAKIGNSVPPTMARVLVEANVDLHDAARKSVG